MKKIITSAMLTGILSLMTFPVANASDMYTSAHFGFSLPDDINFTSTGGVGRLRYTSGYNVSVALGQKINNDFRAEAEVATENQHINEPGWTGDTSHISVLANGYYDFNSNKGGITPYISAGVGYAWTRGWENILPSGVYSAPAYQVGVGIAIPVADKYKIDVRFRHFSMTKVTVDNYYNASASPSYNSILIGLTTNL